jgi:hypothetical protein
MRLPAQIECLALPIGVADHDAYGLRAFLIFVFQGWNLIEQNNAFGALILVHPQPEFIQFVWRCADPAVCKQDEAPDHFDRGAVDDHIELQMLLVLRGPRIHAAKDQAECKGERAKGCRSTAGFPA